MTRTARAAQFERNLLPCVKPIVLPCDTGALPKTISIRGAGVAIPHPEKVKDGKRGVNARTSGFAGEDAYFYTPGSRDMFGMGVADGVYMWREHGIDAGVFARTLMDTAQHLVEAGYSDVVRIAEICQRKARSSAVTSAVSQHISGTHRSESHPSFTFSRASRRRLCATRWSRSGYKRTVSPAGWRAQPLRACSAGSARGRS